MRPTEIVLGRILGFTAVGSVMLLVMGIVGYFFIIRSLDHQQTIAGSTLTRAKLLAGADMAEGNPQLILERGEAGALPPSILVQGLADDNVMPDMADRYRRSRIIGYASLFFAAMVFCTGLAVNAFQLFWARLECAQPHEALLLCADRRRFHTQRLLRLADAYVYHPRYLG